MHKDNGNSCRDRARNMKLFFFFATTVHWGQITFLCLLCFQYYVRWMTRKNSVSAIPGLHKQIFVWWMFNTQLWIYQYLNLWGTAWSGHCLQRWISDTSSHPIKTAVWQKMVSGGERTEAGVWTRLNLYHCVFTSRTEGEFLLIYCLGYYCFHLCHTWSLNWTISKKNPKTMT